jgi:protein-disulfide isomerase
MNRRSARVQQRKQEKKRHQVILFGSILLGVLLVALALTLPSILESMEPVGNIVSPPLSSRPMANGNAMGNPDAPVRVEEFSDFQCPYCSQFHSLVEPQIVKDYIETGRVYFVYIPLYFLGTESKNAAVAAYCARDQGKFWEYKDFIFANHTGENVGDYKKKRLQAFGEKIGLDMALFNSCLGSGKQDGPLNEGKAYADKQAIDSTPSFLVNGKLYDGSNVLKAIAAELSKK